MVRASSAPRPGHWLPAIAYLAVAVAWTWPLALHLSSRFPHDPGDPLLVTYLLWWNARVVPLSRAMWNAPFFWPLPDALALTEHGAGLGLLASPIQWLGGSPLLAYNFLLLVSVWWSALAVYALVNALTRNRAAAFSAGLLWGLAPYRGSQLAHLQVVANWWLPLILLGLHGFYHDGRRRWLALFGASWLLQALSNGYYLFFVPVLVGGWLVCFTRTREDWRRAAAVAAAWTAFSLPLLPVLFEYYTVQHRLGLARSRGEMLVYSATWPSFLRVGPLLRLWPHTEARSQEDFLFPGVTAIVVVAAAALSRRARGRSPRAFFFYSAAAVAMAWLAAGPAPDAQRWSALWHPYGWIAWLPGFGGLRVPERFFMLATLCLAVSAGVAIATLAQSRRRMLAIAGVVAAGAIAEGWIAAMPLGTPPGALGVPIVPHARVLELPVDDDAINVAAMYRGMHHGLPLVNGYAGYIPPHAAVIDWALRRRDPSVLTELRRGHPLYVVVGSSAPADWTAFMDALNEARMLGVSGAGRVYLMPAAPFAAQVTIGPTLTPLRRGESGGWLQFDLGGLRIVRALEIRTRGHFIRLGATIRVDTSVDGSTWTTAVETGPGGPALAGALREPLTVPVRLLLPDPSARFVRVNAAPFPPDAVTIYGPRPGEGR